MESKNDNRGWKKPVSKHFNLILEISRSVIPSFLRKFFLIRKSRASVSNDSELLEFIVPRLKISLLDNCSFSFSLGKKKSLWRNLEKNRYDPKVSLFHLLFLSLSWKNFLMKIVIEGSYIFLPLPPSYWKLASNIFLFVQSAFSKLRRHLVEDKIENYRCPSSKQIYLPGQIQLGIH